VTDRGRSRAFRRVLIANRGEIALRIMRTCHAMGLGTVAIYADPDRAAPFVRAADVAVHIGAPVTGGSFLAIETIVEAARRAGADAVHPGYGFLAENADFAEACRAAGLVFIGPSPEAIRRMGSKIEARKVAEAAGVPTVPGFGGAGLTDAEIAAGAERLGFPVLVKASAGGGGKGMRVVPEAAALGAALAAARREAKGAFGDDTLLVERYLESPRHVEIQILGDAHGHLLHCFERECSIQRRYQKIIEEAPSPALDADARRRMGEAAVALGRALGYENAGTVEFVLDGAGRMYFLEVNTRLQVEHPVTEEITGLDLVRLQIEVAQGRPLGIRQEDLALHGHAIEARIYAEDPRHDFLPSTGRIVCWEEARLPGVRWESGVVTGSEVSIHYDPMLAKVIAHAPTRQEAALRLARTLAATRVHGVRTNVALLVEILRHPDFLAGRIDTHFVGTRISLVPGPTDAERETDRVHAVAAALWQQARRRARARTLPGLPSGWRNNPSQMQEARFTSGDDTVVVGYRVHPHRSIEVVVDGVSRHGRVVSEDDDGIVLVLDGIHRRYGIVEDGETCHVHSSLGTSELVEVPRFPVGRLEQAHGGCRAPMPGQVLAVRVAPGDRVTRGQELVVLEAMKMEHTVTAPADGSVSEVRVAAGQQVDAGEVLVVLDNATAASP
jgi:acetyl-CoA carboxylase biotin carboxylase subunit